MFAEVQTLTPLIPTRELHFLRHCKKLDAEKWAIVDVSFDDFEPDAQTTPSTLCMCLKKPSGCIVEEQASGRCKVTRFHEHDMHGSNRMNNNGLMADSTDLYRGSTKDSSVGYARTR